MLLVSGYFVVDRMVSDKQSVPANYATNADVNNTTPDIKNTAITTVDDHIMPSDSLGHLSEDEQALTLPADDTLSEPVLSRGNNPTYAPILEASSEAVTVEGYLQGFSVNLNQMVIDQLQTGDTLTLPIPVYGEAAVINITDTRNSLNDTEVWRGRLAFDKPYQYQGEIHQGHESDSVIITKGDIQTHISMLTRTGNVTTIIDNATGQGVMVDENQYVTHTPGVSDAVPVPVPGSEHTHNGISHTH